MWKHRLKSWSHFFQAIKRGDKRHDLRVDDRNYAVGDRLLLEEYDNINGKYTGDRIIVEVSYITGRASPCAFSSAVLPAEYVILSLKPVIGGGTIYGPEV